MRDSDVPTTLEGVYRIGDHGDSISCTNPPYGSAPPVQVSDVGGTRNAGRGDDLRRLFRLAALLRGHNYLSYDSIAVSHPSATW